MSRKKQKPATPPEKARADFPVVGIGASAGGLEPLKRLLRALPEDTGMAFVLVQHLSPDYPSMLPEILGRETPMPVEQVVDEPEIRPDHVYVIPPDRTMLLSGSRFRLHTRNHPGAHHPIDAFFRSLAEERHHRSIGVVLSGTLTDGTSGLDAIKAEGGITFAQDDSAQHRGMPQSAIAAGCVDFILPPAGIAAEIARISRHPLVAPAPPAAPPGAAAAGPPPSDVAAPEFARILELLRDRADADFARYRANTLNRRIARRMLLSGLNSPKHYVELLERDPAEVAALCQDILIGVTSFFRDPGAFQVLDEKVFPRLAEGRPFPGPLRVWVLGCSTGEEAYSVAIALDEFTERAGRRHATQIFATDLNLRRIEKARVGLYPKTIAAEVSPERLRRYFVEQEEGYRIAQTIRDRCIFARHNVLADPPFSRLDLVSCRNLLIYMEPPLQEQTLQTFHYALNPGGCLWLGASETVGSQSELFDIVDPRHRIYARKPGARRLPSGAVPGTFRPAPQRSRERGELDPQAHPAADTDLYAEADRILLTKYAPPGVLVDTDWNILQFRGDTSPYLVPAQGRASLNLLKMAREGLLVGLRAAFERARQEGVPAREERLRVTSIGGAREVDVEVVPVEDGAAARTIFLVVFDEPGSRPRLVPRVDPGVPDEMPEEPAHKIRRLTNELGSTRDFLQSVIEQQEASNEDLQSANEEVQSTNEELQSINEELETSKEEIQSSNEELHTVNEELQTRNLELAENRNDLANLVDSVLIPIVLLGRDLRIRRFSPSAETVLNLIHADIGRPLRDLNLPIDMPDLHRLLHDAIENVRTSELQVRDKDGRWWLARIHPYKTQERKIDGAVLTLVDIDALRRAQEAVRDSEERYRLLVEGARDIAVIMLDPEGRVALWNAGAQRQFGYEAQEILGAHVRRFFTPEDVAAGLPEKVLRLARSEISVANDHWLVRRDGSRFWGSGSTTALADEAGRPRGFAKVIRDLTERKALEDDLRGRVEELAAADHRKDEFLAMLAHELRNPLAPLIHALQLLEDRRTGEDLRQDALQIMSRDLARMARLVDDLLDVSRITHGKIPLRKAALDLGSLLRQVALDMRSQIEGRRQELSIDLPEETIGVEADAARLHQVFANLLDNASKFSPTGGRIELRVTTEGEPPKQVLVSVRDEGLGIDAAMLPRVFEVFTQADTSPSRSRGGLGIGLTLVKNLVEMHGGSIEARSAGLNQGSEFIVRLPVAVAPRADLANTPASSTGTVAPPRRILVVDDNVDAARALGLVLRVLGHDVRVVFSSEDCLKAVETFVPEVLFLDIGLPGMDGYEVARAVRRLPGMDELFLVALTGYGREEDRRKTREAGFDYHLVKPAGMEDVQRLLATLAPLAPSASSTSPRRSRSPKHG